MKDEVESVKKNRDGVSTLFAPLLDKKNVCKEERPLRKFYFCKGPHKHGECPKRSEFVVRVQSNKETPLEPRVTYFDSLESVWCTRMGG